MLSPTVAVVIPAWKPDFLQEALESFQRQTNHDFHLYVGDDASPYGLDAIVAPFLASGNVTYHRFPQNLGGKDLVGQWERCIALTHNEPWIWLFSDDDRCSPRCIETLQRGLELHPDTDLFHFGVQPIDGQGHPVAPLQEIALDSARDYLERRILDNYRSYVVEYVFRREPFLEQGGFERFDLAWGSDDATWIRFAARQAPVLLAGAPVEWRASDVNISPRTTPEVASRKIEARLAYFRWLRARPELWTGRLANPRHVSRWFHEQVRHLADSVSLRQIESWCREYRTTANNPWGDSLLWRLRIHASRTKKSLRARLVAGSTPKSGTRH
jgi:glycosyltransferase involved in cell wall biosynthesis